MTEEHSSPIKTPKQLVIVVLLAFAVPITIAALVSQLVTSGDKGTHDNDSLVLSRIQPVGTVILAEATGPKGMLTGEQVYGQVLLISCLISVSKKPVLPVRPNSATRPPGPR